MGETQEKGTSSVKNKEKSSLLDFDLGNDFLNDWKPKSGKKDDTMDLDFGPVTKNKTKAFDFGKEDLDFNLDGDFGKMSSFKMDMSDFDVSSPLKKDAKHKEKSKEGPTSGKNNKGKTDSFDFNFDFNGLDGFNFDSSPRKDKDVPKVQDKGDSSSIDDSQNSRNHLTEEMNIPEDKISQKAVQHGAHLDSIDEDISIKTVTENNNTPSNSITVSEEVPLQIEETSTKKPGPITIEQMSSQSEDTNSPLIHQTCTSNPDSLVKSVHSASKMGSSEENTLDDVHEEVNSEGINVNPSSLTSLQKPNISSSIQETVSEPEKISCAGAATQEASSVNKSVPDITISSVSTSNNGGNSRLSQITRTTSLKVVNSLVQPARKMPSLTSIQPSRTIEANIVSSKSTTGNETKLAENLPPPKKLGIEQMAPKVSKPSNTEKQNLSTMPLKYKTPEEADGNKVEEAMKVISEKKDDHISPSSVSKAEKTKSVGPISVEPMRAKLTQIKRTLPPLKVVNTQKLQSLAKRTPEAKLSSGEENKLGEKSLIPKRVSSLSTMSLKRKTPEAPQVDSIKSNPSKRLSKSPLVTRYAMETSEKLLDKEVLKKLRNQNETHASPINIVEEMNMKVIEPPYTMEDDTNIDLAEACSKELDDICSILRKKHEEAKEILVRAIVNNNKLLMLNHPLHHEKIRMIQKFARSLKLGE